MNKKIYVQLSKKIHVVNVIQMFSEEIQTYFMIKVIGRQVHIEKNFLLHIYTERIHIMKNEIIFQIKNQKLLE